LAIEPLSEKGQLVILDTPFWQLTRPLYMLVHRQKYQGPGLKAFLKFCDEDQA
ncbi:LysR substrate-binding domain-containing protein, partial [Acinetobacter baumannii]